MPASPAAQPGRRARPLARIVVPTDFSPGADAALERAASLPLARHATLYVAHVLPGTLTRKVRGRAEASARRRLDRCAAVAAAAAHRGGNGELELVPLLVCGQAHVEIIRQARAREAELIALGRHSRRPLRDRFLGSTAERVLRMGDLPVRVVNTRPAGPYRRPIVAIDLADTARRVVQLALRLRDPALRLRDPGASRCWLVHAYQVPFEEWMTAADRKEWHDRVAVKLKRFVAGLETPDVHMEPILRAGGPEAVLFEEDPRRVGARARAAGQLAAKVLRNAPCDVAVARRARFTFEMPEMP
jgi:nucleotide-binding universal stress UspA family protein